MRLHRPSWDLASSRGVLRLPGGWLTLRPIVVWTTARLNVWRHALGVVGHGHLAIGLWGRVLGRHWRLCRPFVRSALVTWVCLRVLELAVMPVPSLVCVTVVDYLKRGLPVYRSSACGGRFLGAGGVGSLSLRRLVCHRLFGWGGDWLVGVDALHSHVLCGVCLG